MQTTIQVKTPLDCSADEINAFARLVQTGGEVEPEGLIGRISKAEMLTFLREDDDLIGVGALKNQNANYVKSVFSNAGITADPSKFRRELGWVVVASDHENRGHSRRIVGALLQCAGGAALYATSNTKRVAMHRTLGRYGFKIEGHPWASKRHQDEELVLFVLHPPGP